MGRGKWSLPNDLSLFVTFCCRFSKGLPESGLSSWKTKETQKTLIALDYIGNCAGGNGNGCLNLEENEFLQ